MESQENFPTPSSVVHLQLNAPRMIFLVLLMAVALALPALAQNWTTLPGSATAISSNAKGDVWAIGTEPSPGGYKIWRWNHGGWQNIAGGAVRIAVDPDGTAWVVTSTGAIFHSNVSGQWMPVPGTATDIAVGAKGDIWALGTARVGNDYGVWHAVVAPGTRTLTGWQAVSGAAVRIAVDAEGNPWVVTRTGIIFHLQGGHWLGVGAFGLGEGKAISLGPDGVLYAVGPTEEARLGGFTIFRYQNAKWQALNVGGIELAAGAAGTVYVVQNSSKRFAILSNSGLPTASYAVAAAPAPPAAPVVTPPSAPAKPSATPAASANPTPAPAAPSTVSGPSSKPVAQPAATGTAAASPSAPTTVAAAPANPATPPASASASANGAQQIPLSATTVNVPGAGTSTAAAANGAPGVAAGGAIGAVLAAQAAGNTSGLAQAPTASTSSGNNPLHQDQNSGNTAPAAQSSATPLARPASTITLNQPGTVSLGSITANSGPGAAAGSSSAGSTTSGTVTAQPSLASSSGSLASTSSTQLQVSGLTYVPLKFPSGVSLVNLVSGLPYAYTPGKLLCSDPRNMGEVTGGGCGTTDAGFLGGYNLTTSCPSGQFYDPMNGGTCWTCPDSSDGKGNWIRSADPVTSDTACWRIPSDGSAKQTSPATFVNYDGCNDPQQQKSSGALWRNDKRLPGPPFVDIASGLSTTANNDGNGACWTCPTADQNGNYIYTERNAATLIGLTTGNYGCRIRLTYQPGVFYEPGLSGLAGVYDVLTAQQVFQRPAALTQYLYTAAQNLNLEKRSASSWVASQWQDIAAHPYQNVSIKALVYAYMLGTAPPYMYSSGSAANQSATAVSAQAELVNSFQQYMQARNTYIAQQALDVYNAWENNLAATQGSQPETVTLFYYGTVPLDFQSIVSGAVVPTTTAMAVMTSVAGPFAYVAAQQALIAVKEATGATVIMVDVAEKGKFVQQIASVGDILDALGAGGDVLSQISMLAGPVSIAVNGVVMSALAIQQVVEIATAQSDLNNVKNNAMQPVSLSQMMQTPNGSDQVAAYWGYATGVQSDPGIWAINSAAQTAYAAAKQSNFATLGQQPSSQAAGQVQATPNQTQSGPTPTRTRPAVTH